MGKILIVSANLGNFDKVIENVPQHLPDGFSIVVHRFTDDNFPPRFNTMTPRLQARIPKMMAWQMLPDFDYYIWIDSSCYLSDQDSVEWFLNKLGSADMAVFKHPHRKTVQEEADYLIHRLDIKCRYITPRYENERIDDQLTVVDPNAELYASTAFIYRNNAVMHDLMTIWWLHTSLYHSIDQLSLPTAIKHSGAKVSIVPNNYLKIPYLTYVRNK